MKASTNSISASLLRLWRYTLLGKILLAAVLPLTADEAYYWVWSLFPDWSYFDHPAMTAWMFTLSPYAEALPGLSRLPFVVMGHATLFIWLRLMAPVLSENAQKLLFLILLFHPFSGLGSLLGTPDVPLAFFWSLSLLLVSRIQNEHRLPDFALLGAALGLGFCSKYMIVLFVPALLLQVLLMPADERAKVLRPRGIFLTVVTGLMFSFPVLYWNFTHDWASIKFQTEHGLGETQWNPKWTLEYLSGQIFLLFPALIYSVAKHRPPKQVRWLTSYALVPILFFLFTSFRGHVEANWPLVAYFPFLALVVAGADNMKKDKLIRWTLILWASLTVVAITESAHHWLPVDKRKIKIHDYSQYDDLVKDAKALTEIGEVVFTGSYQMASVMTYRAQYLYPKLPGINRYDFFDQMNTGIPNRFYLFAIIWYDLPSDLKQRGYQVLSVKKYGEDFKLLEVELK